MLCAACACSCRLRMRREPEGGERLGNAVALRVLDGLCSSILLDYMDADGRGIRTYDFGRHVDFAVELSDFPPMEPVPSFRVASPRRPERDGLFLLHMCVFGERAVHAKRPARTDGAVRVFRVAVQRDVVSGSNHGGQGGGDRLF